MMRISFESDMVMPTISKAILELTDSTTVCLNDIHYDEAQGIVKIYFQRREITEFKSSYWFGGGVKKVYGQARIKSLLTIRQVEGMDIDVDDWLVTECNSCFTVLFGVHMDRNKVYLGSLEESRGKLLCEISIKVKKLDIEYAEAVMKM